MAGVQAQTDVRELEHPLDLPWSFDVCPGLVMEGGFVPSIAAPSDHVAEADAEPLPGIGIEADAAVVDGSTGTRSTDLAAAVGERGPGGRPHPMRRDRVEDIEDGIERRQGATKGLVIRIRQLEVRAGQAELARGQALAQLRVAAEVAHGPKVDAGVAGRRHLVEDVDAVGHVRIDADGQLERAVADRGVGDDDAGPSLRSGRVHAVRVGWSIGRPVR